MVFNWKGALPSDASCLFVCSIIPWIWIGSTWRSSSVRTPPGCTAAARMPFPMTPVKSDGEEDLRSLGPAVGDPWVVRCSHKVGIFEVDVGEAVPGRREVDQTPSLADKRRDTVDENEV